MDAFESVKSPFVVSSINYLYFVGVETEDQGGKFTTQVPPDPSFFTLWALEGTESRFMCRGERSKWGGHNAEVENTKR